MGKWLRIITIIFLVGLLFYSDFIRDYLFKNIGFQIYYLQHIGIDGYSTIDNYTDSLLEKLFTNYSISNLVNLKWILTIFFSVFYGILCALISYLFYKKKEVILYTSILYVSLFFAAGMIYLMRYFSDSYEWQENTYLISMQLTHFLQSSLPTLLILASFKIYLSYKDSTVNK